MLPLSFFLLTSGACALVYQTVWLRELRLVFGASTAASAAVLAVFMGGLGFGSWWLGRLADHSSRPLRLFGNLELGVAASAALTPALIYGAQALYVAVGGTAVLGATFGTLVRLVLTTLVLGTTTFLMGGSLPAAVRSVARDSDAGRRRVALMYGINAVGAVLGVLLATFVFLEVLGSRDTLWCAALLNGLVGVSARALSRRLPAQKPDHDVTHAPPPEAGLAHRPWFVAPAAGVLGFVFFVMELVWYRMLGPLLGGTVYTFGVILAVVLAGIGLGGLVYSVWWAKGRPTLGTFALTCMLQAAVLALPFAWGDSVALWAMLLRSLGSLGFAGLATSWVVITALVVFPTAFVSGLQFPLLVSLLGRGRREVGHHLGWTYAANTVGAIAGALAGGFGLVSWLSAQGAWQLCIAMLVLLGAVAWAAAWHDRHASWHHEPVAKPPVRKHPPRLAPGARRGGAGSSSGGAAQAEPWENFASVAAWLEGPLTALGLGRGRGSKATPTRRRWGVPAATGALALCAVVWGMATGPTAAWRHAPIGSGLVRLFESDPVTLHGFQRAVRRFIEWEVDGVESSVALRNRDGMAFVVNGKVDGNATGDAGTQVMLGVMGALLHPNPKRAMVIGLGTGSSAGWLASVPAMDQVASVELEPAILDVARACGPVNKDVMDNPKVQHIIGDAREVLATSKGTFDLVVSEPSNPYRAGIASLYTQEFYSAVRERLSEDGLLLQWTQAYHVTPQTVRTVLATLASTFEWVETWQTQASDLLFIASKNPPSYTLDDLRARITQEPFAEALRVAWGTRSVEGVMARFVARDALARRVFHKEVDYLNTDDRMRVEFGFARSVGKRQPFSIEDLRQTARELGFGQPPVGATALDAGLIARERWNLYVYDERTPPALPKGGLAKPQPGKRRLGTLDDEAQSVDKAREQLQQQRRAAAHYGRGQLRAALEAWQAQDSDPHTRIEYLLLAEGLAERTEKGTPRTGTLHADAVLAALEALRRWHPVEAMAVEARWHWRRGDVDAAVAQLGDVFMAYREDPWPYEPLMERTMHLAMTIAKDAPHTARLLHQVLGERFAVANLNAMRQKALLAIAEDADFEGQCVGVLAAMEPNVPWEESLLRRRVDCYVANGHPWVQRAAREYDQFMHERPMQFAWGLSEPPGGRLPTLPYAGAEP